MVEAPSQLSSLAVSTPAVTLLQRLRVATAAQHKALEARLPLTHADLDRTTYTRIIEAYYGFHVPLQRRIEALVGADAFEPERQKIPALLKDLRALGLDDRDIEALPQCTELPLFDCRAGLLGVMYVMEGATLGGQVLRRIISAQLGIDAETGGEFLDVYGRETGRLWKAFLNQLADFDQPDVTPLTVDAACHTFACFEAWLESAGVLR